MIPLTIQTASFHAMQIKARHTVITITSILCLASFLTSPQIYTPLSDNSKDPREQ